jgi:16S rRNA (uracil1498-N3)-methyltransferase
VSAPAFLVPALPDGDVCTLDGPEGHHAATVQRLRVGEAILLGDGRGARATGTVTAVGKGTLEVRLGERSYEPAPDPRIVVVQGIAKGDRGELAVQAMTEVGVDAIVPWAAARSVAKWTSDRAHQRWVDTAREAAKQARRAWVPDVPAAHSTVAVADYLGTAGAALVLHEEAVARLTTVDLPPSGEIVLVVGPEGGIAPEELAAYEKVGAVLVRLGDTVLRTSTAGPAALAVLSARLGRW